jgi:Rps23 Pro-64 3,4-dihydroxylase Tpa1-like proline 4-hydroxylase
MTPVDPLQCIVDKFDEDYSQFANMLYYRYHPGSYILWHVDSGYKSMYNKGFTLYMNNIWDRNWGGQLLHGDDSFVSPKANRLVVMDRDTPHAVARTSTNAPFRVCVQGWILNGTRDEYGFEH